MSQLHQQSFVFPNWPIANNIKAFTTTRLGGVSTSPYNALNLGFHVGDSPCSVSSNEQLLRQYLGEHVSLKWMQQTHSVNVFNANDVESMRTEGDAMYSDRRFQACSVLTADCLPILLLYLRIH